ncbi:MAG: glycosyltransferase family 4 protein [Flavobacteriia bacterium]|nr:glycosyltransferase family 4 protein [Flavobacteriia bacterium]
MRIAVNTRFLLPSKMEGFGWYTFEIVKRIVKQHPEHEFFFFFDRPYDSQFIFEKNVTPVVLYPPARHPILFFIWFEFAIKRALKKYKIDVFFSPDGYLSLNSNIPQIAVIHDLNFEHFPKDIPLSARLYLRHFFPKFAKKAAKIITVSTYSKQDIQHTYAIPEEKIIAIWNGVSNVFKPINENEKIGFRHQYANGKPYFLFVGAIHPRKNIPRLLEAYSIYKQQKESDFDLVIVGESLWKNALNKIIIKEEIKKHIHFTGHLKIEELANVMASASIFVFVPYFEGFGIPLVEAMKCGTPIISGNLTSLPEVATDSAIFCNPYDSNEIAQQMINLANSEELQKIYSKKGLARSKFFSWDNSADKVWNEIEKFLK